MNKRSVVVTDQIYHVFNRTVGNEPLFPSKREFNRFLELVAYYRFPQRFKYSKYKKLSVEQKNDYLEEFSKLKPLIEIYAFALMPNHYHFLLKQNQDNGIKTFISNIQNGFAKYINTKFDRHGGLFQNTFKRKWIGTDEELLHVSRYIHLNPVTAYIVNFNYLLSDVATSFRNYVNEDRNGFINIDVILSLIGGSKKYKKFVEDQVSYQRELDKIKHLIIE